MKKNDISKKKHSGCTVFLLVFLTIAVITTSIFIFSPYISSHGKNIELPVEQSEQSASPEPFRNLPILMYHHFDEASKADTVVTAGKFREQIKAIYDAGFTSVTLNQIIDYVDNGSPLPTKPVLITIDDGYTSNLAIAAPILEEYGMCATIFVIGINEGKMYYAHTSIPFTAARFSYEEAAPWVDKGVIDLQSHTFDMHQLKSYGYSMRDGIRPMENETEAHYINALQMDFTEYLDHRYGRVQTDLVALSYPFGYYTETADRIFKSCGIKITVTTEEHTNTLKYGDSSTMRLLGRFNITERITGEALTEKLLASI